MDNWIAGIDLDLGEDTPPADDIVESWAFIYVRPAADAPADRVEIERDGIRTTLVGIPEQAAVIEAAVDLVDSGVQVIELCGILGPVWAARVIEATGGRVPVGAVSYGAESVALFLDWGPHGSGKFTDGVSDSVRDVAI
jgi:Family of unknown function (DUF6506)